MNKELEQVKRNVSRPVIHRVFVVESGTSLRNHWSYSDSDSMTDYYNGSGGSEKYLIECLLKDGGECIHVYTNGGQEENDKTTALLLKKIDRIAKKTHYKNNVKGFYKEFRGYKGEIVKEFVIEGTFERIEGVSNPNLY